MYADARGPYLIAPIVLRLALAVIFLYHGFYKVWGREKDWGAAWATIMWQQQARIPPDVDRKLDDLVKTNPDLKQEVGDMRSRLGKLYADEAQGVEQGIELTQAAQLAVAWGELLGGLAMLLGCLTRLAAIGLIIIQVGAIATITFQRGFSFAAGGGYEYNLALVGMCLALLITGAGLLSVDRQWSLRRRGAATAAAPAHGVPTAV
jgi:uncharacterized membrane protein YphA (DoxX/SURF4 family)